MARGTFIGIYAGQYITKDEGIRRMASTGGSYLFDLDFYHLQGINPSYMIDGERMGNVCATSSSHWWSLANQPFQFARYMVWVQIML